MVELLARTENGSLTSVVREPGESKDALSERARAAMGRDDEAMSAVPHAGVYVERRVNPLLEYARLNDLGSVLLRSSDPAYYTAQTQGQWYP